MRSFSLRVPCTRLKVVVMTLRASLFRTCITPPHAHRLSETAVQESDVSPCGTDYGGEGGWVESVILKIEVAFRGLWK